MGNFNSKTNQLLQASQSGSVNDVKSLLSSSSTGSLSLSVFEQDRREETKGYTALHHACVNVMGHPDIAEMLLEHGAEVNHADNRWQNTPLHLAAYLGHVTITRLLIEHGADLNRLNAKGQSAFMLAFSNGYTNTARLLLEAGASPGGVMRKGWLRNKDASGRTHLHRAAKGGFLRIAELVLRHGAELNEVDDQGRTALHVASYWGQVGMVRLLLKHGAAQSANANGETPLHRAAWRGHADVAQLLVQHGADVGAADSDGHTAHQLAQSRGHEGVLQVLDAADAMLAAPRLVRRETSANSCAA